MALTELNVKAIDKTIEAIKKTTGDRFQMSVFINDFGYTGRIHTCETAACIAGWACLANLPRDERIRQTISSNWDKMGADVLGLSLYPHSAAHELFLLGAYDRDDKIVEIVKDIFSKFGLYYNRERTVLSNFDQLPERFRKQAAVNVLTILKEMGKVDWVTALEMAYKEYSNIL